LKRKIQEALQRLEKENLVSRSGDLYFFLTNEEREVTRAIKNVVVDSSAEPSLLREIIYEDVLKGKTKHRFDQYKSDYAFNRLCDGVPYGTRGEHDLTLEVITPLNDQYSLFSDSRCIIYTSEPPRALLKLPDNKDLLRELRTYVQTDKYIKNKNDVTASPSLKRILWNQQDDNRQRRERIVGMVADLMINSECYALGNTLDLKANSPRAVADEALDFLIRNIYNKFSYLKHLTNNPQPEIRLVLQSDDLTQEQLKMDLGAVNSEALQEVLTYLHLKTVSNQIVYLNDLVEHFSKRPFGWPEWEVVLLIARLFMGGEINLDSTDKGRLDPQKAIDPLTKTGQWKTVKIHKRKIIGEKDLKEARELGQTLFGSIGGEKQDELAAFLKERLGKWQESLGQWKPLADTGHYPGQKEIDEGMVFLKALLSINDPYEFIKEFNKRQKDLTDTSHDFHALKDFYTNQKSTWETLRKSLDKYKPNASIIGKYPEASAAWNRMNQITEAPAPYGMLHEVSGLISKVSAINEQVVQEKRESATQEVDRLIENLKAELEAKNADSDLRNKCLYPLQETKKQIQVDDSVPQISYRMEEAKEQFEEALSHIEAAFKTKDERKPVPKVRIIKPSAYASKTYLETKQDVEEYVSKVRDELMDAVQKGLRIRIQ